MAALIWLVAGVLLATAEALAGGFFLLMLSGAALATAAVTAISDFPVWIDAVVFGVVSLALVVGLRPALLRRFGVPPEVPTNTAALSGKQALVLEEVGANAGQVKLGGDVWTARPLDVTEVYPPGTTVTVIEIDGATAVVWRGP
ncbi:NfeD family protein [Rhodococcus sp. ABRD24]|uniref:NfeD family protein n=1 Tax=Rhodococcus sp. ABRD24 TaxID=2507582 RepID=UPI00103FD01E|nr:NfeD family protein [Rhodococcus sp. ABRD24]QBJ98415.1 NfeD family protein [Rhodococcus sp. ABRD24]